MVPFAQPGEASLPKFFRPKTLLIGIVMLVTWMSYRPGLGGSWTVQAVIPVLLGNSKYGATIRSCSSRPGNDDFAAASLRLGATTLCCGGDTIRNGTLLSLPSQHTPVLAFQQTNRRPRWATV